jgi:hypothetical protein
MRSAGYLCDLILTLSPATRDKLCRVLILDQPDRCRPGFATATPMGDGWLGMIDALSMYPDALRKVVRMLAEIDAAGWLRIHSSQILPREAPR